MDTLGWKIGDRFKVIGAIYHSYVGMEFTVSGFSENSNGELLLCDQPNGRRFHYTFCKNITRDENAIEAQEF